MEDKSTIHYEHIRRRTVSKFEPSTYDMCSIGSFPLNLEWNEDALQIPASSLEYLRSQLPDSSEFEKYVTDLLAQSGCNLRFASFCGNTMDVAARMTANGGCKILNLMAMTVNPWTMDSDHSPPRTLTINATLITFWWKRPRPKDDGSKCRI